MDFLVDRNGFGVKLGLGLELGVPRVVLRGAAVQVVLVGISAFATTHSTHQPQQLTVVEWQGWWSCCLVRRAIPSRRRRC